MKKFSNSPITLIGVMVAFILCLVFGMIFGPKYPTAFALFFLTVFAAFIALYVATTKKDAVILIAGVLVLCIWTTIVDDYILRSLSESLLRDGLGCLLVAPVFVTLLMLFMKMTEKKQKSNPKTE